MSDTAPHLLMLYGEEENIIEIFGHNQPTLAERREQTLGKWREWEANEIDLEVGCASQARKILRKLGLRHLLDFAIVENLIRFRRQEDMFFALMSDLGTLRRGCDSEPYQSDMFPKIDDEPDVVEEMLQSPMAGDCYYDTDYSRIMIYDGLEWNEMS